MSLDPSNSSERERHDLDLSEATVAAASETNSEALETAAEPSGDPGPAPEEPVKDSADAVQNPQPEDGVPEEEEGWPEFDWGNIRGAVNHPTGTKGGGGQRPGSLKN